MRWPCRRGGSLIEALTALALVALLLAGAAAGAQRAVRRARVPAAARAAASDVRLLRSEAIARARNGGMRFERSAEGAWMVSFVEDGDGDGIRSDDLRRGIDRITEGPVPVRDRWGIEPGYARSLVSLTSPPPDEDRLSNLEDPVRFGSRDIVSCSSRGTITPGTFYLSDGSERQLAVVVAGSTGRVRVWEYQLERRLWVLR